MSLRTLASGLWVARSVLAMLLACSALWSAQGAEALPELRIDTQRTEPSVLVERLVFLPDDISAAQRLLYTWNAQNAVGSEAADSLVIPPVGRIYGGAVPLQPWATTQGGELYAAAPESFAHDFELYQSAHFRGVIVIPMPTSEHRRVVQYYVDNAWLAQGHSAPPRQQGLSGEVSVGSAMHKIAKNSGVAQLTWAHLVMIAVGLLLLWLGIGKKFEPLLLVPIAVGCILVNAAGANMAGAPGSENPGILGFFYEFGIASGMFPLLIFLGVGALTDFGPLLANPWSALLGAAAQFGIFGTFFLATAFGVFTIEEAGAIAIIGGADGPTSIYVASKLAPHLLGAIAVAAYSYMALVPIIQPPIMKLFTNHEERRIMMTQRRPVSRQARIFFPIIVILLCILTLPDAVPLIGMLMFGNILRESLVTDRLVKAAQNELINLVTIGLGLAVGTKLNAEEFLNPRTLLIIVLGCAAFMVGTAAGVIFGKIMCKITGGKVNPLIGAAGVSAVPMAARVAQTVGQQYNKKNMLLMHAMGPNVSGVIGSAVAAGILLALLA